jgi:hypothetical protein
MLCGWGREGRKKVSVTADIKTDKLCCSFVETGNQLMGQLQSSMQEWHLVTVPAVYVEISMGAKGMDSVAGLGG